MKRFKILLACLALAAASFAVLLFLTHDSGPSHQGRSAEQWLDAAVLSKFEGKENPEKLREAFASMGEGGAKFLGAEILKEENLIHQLAERMPLKTLGISWLNEFRLKNLSAARRMQAADVLASLGPEAGPAVAMFMTHMIRAIESEKGFPYDSLICRVLSQSGPALDPWIPVLLEIWRDHPKSRPWIAWILVASGPKAQSAVPLILEEIQSNRTPLVFVESAGFIATDSPDLAVELTRILRNADYDEELSKTWQITGQGSMTIYPDRNLLRAASFALGNLRLEGVVGFESLQSCMIWRDAEIRGNLLRAVGRFKNDADRVLTWLNPFFNDEDPWIRLRAAQAWTRIAGANGLPSRIVSEMNVSTPAQPPFEKMTRAGVRWRITRDAGPLLAAIAEVQILDDDKSRLEAVEWLAELPKELSLAKPLLENASKDSNGLIRHRAREALLLHAKDI